MGLQAEVAVHQSRVETEVLQPGLQGGHVVAVHRGAELMRQRPRTQSVGRFPERAVGGPADDPVDDQAAALLEGAYRVIELGIEDIQRYLLAGGEVVIRILEQPQGGQYGPDFDDGPAAVAAAQCVR